MSDITKKLTNNGWAVLVAALMITFAGIKAASEIVVPFLLALFIAIVCYPVVDLMVRRKIPRIIAVLLVLAVVAVFCLLLGGLLAASVNDFSRTVPQYKGEIAARIHMLMALAAKFNITISADYIQQLLDPSIIMQMISRMVSSFSGIMANVFLLLLTVVFMLFEAPSAKGKIHLALDDPEMRLQQVDRVLDSVNRYLTIKTWISLLTGILAWALLSALGVRYAILWGTVAFLLNYIPNIGSVIAAIPPLLQALLLNGVPEASGVAAGYVLINLLCGNVLEPRYMGKGLGLSTLVVFLSLIFWGWLLGSVGMLLSVPLTMAVKIALESNPQYRKLAILLGDGREVAEECEKGDCGKQAQSEKAESSASA
ncbi:MAG: AI-2E family transporter [Plesiomonas sp.]|uniref:AI-2E family transporter n=1 Tax=Plesiomonas sp. TaxID=2486279 RepID=UPI003F35DD2E